jgi:hypothetical protein
MENGAVDIHNKIYNRQNDIVEIVRKRHKKGERERESAREQTCLITAVQDSYQFSTTFCQFADAITNTMRFDLARSRTYPHDVKVRFIH